MTSSRDHADLLSEKPAAVSAAGIFREKVESSRLIILDHVLVTERSVKKHVRAERKSGDAFAVREQVIADTLVPPLVPHGKTRKVGDTCGNPGDHVLDLSIEFSSRADIEAAGAEDLLILTERDEYDTGSDGILDGLDRLGSCLDIGIRDAGIAAVGLHRLVHQAEDRLRLGHSCFSNVDISHAFHS